MNNERYKHLLVPAYYRNKDSLKIKALPRSVEMYHHRIPNLSHWFLLIWVPLLYTLVRRLLPPPLHCAFSVPIKETYNYAIYIR